MKAARLSILLIFLSVNSSSAEWRFEAYGGKFYPGRSDLTIYRPRAGDNLTYHDLEWEDRSWEHPIYYGYRISWFLPGSLRNGIELEFIHPKIHSDPSSRLLATGTLARQPVSGVRVLGDHIELFDISHGLNFLLINWAYRRAWRMSGPVGPGKSYLVFRSGLGPCICHTESLIDNVFMEHYELGGLGVQAALGAVIPIIGRLYLPLEYKITYAWLRNLDIYGGKARLNAAGFHLILAAGIWL